MKKFISLALALVLVLSMAVVVFADGATITDNTDKNASATVKGQYVAVEAADTISVSVNWINATWTYSVTKTWNDTTFEEEVTEAGVWANAADAEDVDAKTEITVTNKSNVDITTAYSVQYMQAGATGTLSAETGEIRKAVPVEVGNEENTGAASETVTLDITGELTGDYEDNAEFEVAVVTITVAKKNA